MMIVLYGSDEDTPRLIPHVQTSRAGNGEVDVTPMIHQALKEKDLLPKEHLTDINYAEAKQFVQSREEYGIDLVAPTWSDHKRQAKERQGFDAGSFQIDWERQKMTCPVGQESLSWTPAIGRRDNAVIKIKCSIKDCRGCQRKAQCTTAPRRTITIRAQEHHQALLHMRARQKEGAFWELSRARAGIEGTISQGVPAFGMRTQYTFSGKRIKRGLYRASDGRLINADINGAGNVIRKIAPDAFAEVEGVEDGKAVLASLVVHPVRFVVVPSRTQKASNGGSKRSRERYKTLCFALFFWNYLLASKWIGGEDE